MISDPHLTKNIIIQNREVPVWIYGEENKPLIIFIHGYFRGFSQYKGDLPMRYLMKNYCVIVFDLPGFGLSKEIKMDRVDFIHEIIDKLFKEREFVLFGISYGGALEIKYALKYPEHVKGLIIGGMPYFYGFKQAIKLSYLIALIRNFDLPRVLKQFRFLNKENLAKIIIPTLLLYSASDSQATVAMGKRLNDLIPNSKLFTISGRRHSWLMHEINKSGFLDEINYFLKKIGF